MQQPEATTPRPEVTLQQPEAAQQLEAAQQPEAERKPEVAHQPEVAQVTPPRPEVTPPRPEPAATPNIPDPTHQESIPDSLNTDDIPSLHQWSTEDLPGSGTPATGSRGPTDPVIRIPPGSVPQSQPRRAGSVQTNLFGGTPDDSATGFCCHMRQLADELRAETGEERRISSDEDDPATWNPVEEIAAEPGAGNQEGEEEAADEDEEDDDPSYGNSGEDDDDSPLASSHRPVTQSTPKKPVARPKWKAYRNKSGPGSSSRKRTRRR